MRDIFLSHLGVSLKPHAGIGQTLMVALKDAARVIRHEGGLRLSYTEYQNCTIIDLEGNPVPFSTFYTVIPPDGGLRVEGTREEIVVRVVQLVQRWTWG